MVILTRLQLLPCPQMEDTSLLDKYSYMELRYYTTHQLFSKKSQLTIRVITITGKCDYLGLEASH